MTANEFNEDVEELTSCSDSSVSVKDLLLRLSVQVSFQPMNVSIEFATAYR